MNSTNGTTTESGDLQLSAGFSALVSLSYFLLFVAALILYILVFIALSKNRKEFSSPYYKYIVSLAIGEFLSAIYFGVFGALCTALSYCPVSMLANTIITGVIQPGWPIEVATDIAIAFDRFVAVCFYSKYTSIFSDKIPITIIAATWIYALVYSSPAYSLLVPMFYDPSVVTMDSFSELAPIVGYVQMCADATMLAVSALFYSFAFASMWRRRKETLTGNSATLRRLQLALVVQGFSHFLMVALNDAIYNGYVLPYNSSGVASWISNVVFMLIPLTNVVFLLIFNSAVRGKVRDLFRTQQHDALQQLHPLNNLSRSAPSLSSVQRQTLRRSNAVTAF